MGELRIIEVRQSVFADNDADARMRNPGIEILFVSAKTGGGVDRVADWIEKNTREWNET